jgi:DNA-binding NtrC family response regulator
MLVHHFVDVSASELRCKKPRLTRATMEKLQLYGWPGNIRELRNVIERAVILARGGALDFDLPDDDPSRHPILAPVHIAEIGKPELLTEAQVQQRERENLLAVLNKTGWKIKGADGAAEFLGVKPPTLAARMRKMNLKRPAK